MINMEREKLKEETRKPFTAAAVRDRGDGL